MIGVHTAWSRDDTDPEPRVVEVYEVAFETFRPPVALGPAVTHGIDISGERIQLMRGTPTLEGLVRYLVVYDDGVIARATKSDVNQATARQGDGHVLP